MRRLLLAADGHPCDLAAHPRQRNHLACCFRRHLRFGLGRLLGWGLFLHLGLGLGGLLSRGLFLWHLGHRLGGFLSRGFFLWHLGLGPGGLVSRGFFLWHLGLGLGGRILCRGLFLHLGLGLGGLLGRGLIGRFGFGLGDLFGRSFFLYLRFGLFRLGSEGENVVSRDTSSRAGPLDEAQVYALLFGELSGDGRGTEIVFEHGCPLLLGFCGLGF